MAVCPCVVYLPVLAVLKSVADLIFGLKQEIFESGRGLPANTQLVFQLADTTDGHTCRRVGGHWKEEETRERLSRRKISSTQN